MKTRSNFKINLFLFICCLLLICCDDSTTNELSDNSISNKNEDTSYSISRTFLSEINVVEFCLRNKEIVEFQIDGIKQTDLCINADCTKYHFFITKGTHVLKWETSASNIKSIKFVDNVESPNIVSFENGKMPESWFCLDCRIDSTSGLGDENSIIFDNMNSFGDLCTAKTCDSTTNVIEFYIRQNLENVYTKFFIDGKVCGSFLTTSSWTKYHFYCSPGKHTFKWRSSLNASIDKISFKKGLAPGLPYQGGIIAYVDSTEKHGFIVAPYDQNSGICLFDKVLPYHPRPMQNGQKIGDGNKNTKQIVDMCGDGYYAAKICDTLSLNGYCDWYLPSIDELKQIYIYSNFIGNFSTIYNQNSYYWSSSVFNSNYLYIGFDWGRIYEDPVGSNKNRVRAIRSF